MVTEFLLISNPFLEAYTQSDFLGKLIFFGLYALSLSSWTVIIYKMWITFQARKYAYRFYEAFKLQKRTPLGLDYENLGNPLQRNPFLEIYKTLKKQSLDLLNKNQQDPSKPAFLSMRDLDFVQSHLSILVANQTKELEKHLYVLSTTVSLAPFLGLLGTVWGILTTFSQLQMQNSGNTHQLVLGGLSLALATTVLGLIDAIPAMIGYNYLKNTIRDFSTEMEGFSHEVLATVELQYRREEN